MMEGTSACEVRDNLFPFNSIVQKLRWNPPDDQQLVILAVVRRLAYFYKTPI